ncbi:MAG: hypothetical protein ABIR92_04280 [Gemmatimonadaceae bacterium]
MNRDRRVGASGVLEPAEDVEIPSMMQTRFELPSGRFCFQNPLAIEWFGAATTRAADAGDARLTSLAVSAPIGPPPLGSENAHGVAPDDVLEIRDATGHAIDTDVVSLQHVKAAPDVDLSLHSEATEIFQTARQAWIVWFAVRQRDEDV